MYLALLKLKIVTKRMLLQVLYAEHILYTNRKVYIALFTKTKMLKISTIMACIFTSTYRSNGGISNSQVSIPKTLSNFAVIRGALPSC